MFTIEGVVSAIILIIALGVVFSAITFDSPQTEKIRVTKLDIKAQDILNTLASEDRPGEHSSSLLRNVSRWNCTERIGNENLNASEPSIKDINNDTRMLVDKNLQYNMELRYYNDTQSLATGNPVYDTHTIIFQGEPMDNVGTGTKLIILNNNTSVNKSVYWSNMEMPKAVEVRLVIWPV